MAIIANSSGAPGSTGAATQLGRALPPHLQRAMSRITEISSLPEITTRIIQVVEDPQATARDMHEIVKNDPGLASKVLKVVNSAFYGLPSQIASLDRAIIMLGLSAVKNIALAASLARLFKVEALSDRFGARDLWRHCVAVGVCARSLANKACIGEAEEYFVAGLVHDIGLLVIGQLFPTKFRAVAERCYNHPQSYCAAERELVGADHQAFGATLSTKWKFPPALRYAIAYHHEPGSLRPEFRKVVTFISVADTICGKMQHGYYLTAQAQEVTEGQLETIGLNAGSMGEVCQELPEHIATAEQVFGNE